MVCTSVILQSRAFVCVIEWWSNQPTVSEEGNMTCHPSPYPLPRQGGSSGIEYSFSQEKIMPIRRITTSLGSQRVERTLACPSFSHEYLSRVILGIIIHVEWLSSLLTYSNTIHGLLYFISTKGQTIHHTSYTRTQTGSSGGKQSARLKNTHRDDEHIISIHI